MNEIINAQIGFAIGAIAGVKRERDQLREWQRNALAVTKRQAETTKALESRLAQWESIFKETDPEKVREYHQQLVVFTNDEAARNIDLSQQLRELRCHVDAVRSGELTNLIAEREADVTRLKKELAIEQASHQRTSSQAEEFCRTIERMREPLCRAAEQQACNERLMAELAKANARVEEHEEAFAIQNRDMKSLLATISALRAELDEAPRWVPVGDMDVAQHDQAVVCDSDDGYFCEAFLDDADTWCDAAGDPLEFTPTHVLANLNPPDVAPNEDRSPQCVDMLNRPVAVGDVVWDAIARTFVTHLADTTKPDSVEYDHCVRVPGPGEDIPDFDGWREMCRAMQATRAVFECLQEGKWSHPNISGLLNFIDSVTKYRRSDKCKWEWPK